MEMQELTDEQEQMCAELYWQINRLVAGKPGAVVLFVQIQLLAISLTLIPVEERKEFLVWLVKEIWQENRYYETEKMTGEGGSGE